MKTCLTAWIVTTAINLSKHTHALCLYLFPEFCPLIASDRNSMWAVNCSLTHYLIHVCMYNDSWESRQALCLSVNGKKKQRERKIADFSLNRAVIAGIPVTSSSL